MTAAITAVWRLSPPAAALALATLATGCATLNPPPPVEVLPTAPPPINAAPPARHSATGSLFHAASYRPALDDRRARMVGDTVTVMIEESVSATQNASSSTDRTSKATGGISALPFIGGNIAGKTQLGADSANSFSGKGDTVNKNDFKGTLTTTVIDVLPNGHLIVSGEKQVGVNQNVDVLRFSGTVDPRALRPGSVVSSTQVANVRIESRGKGAQAEVQSMGWLGRFFNSITPF